MIITRLIGGLGNQMFQYATGRALAQRLETSLKLDTTPFETYDLHRYALHHFNIRAPLATPADLDRVARGQSWKRRAWNAAVCGLTLGAVRPIRYISEEGHAFDPQILRLKGDVYLSGYWQSERYFRNVDRVIRHEFTQVTPRVAANQRCAGRIQAQAESVSLHVRRADYVSDARTTVLHGLCSPAYYQRCLQRLRDRVGTPHVFVFSDDIAWARRELDLGCPTTYLGHNGPDRNYEDLALMSQCRHHIIGNSTFSWWGAWLDPRPGKLVFAPTPFFDQSDRDDSDLVPEAWTRVARAA